MGEYECEKVQINDLPELTLLHQPNDELDDVYAQIHKMGEPAVFRSPDGDGLIITSYAALHDLRKSPDLQSLKRDLRIGGSGEVGALAKISAYSPFFADEPMHKPLAAATYGPLGPARETPISERFTECVTDTLVSIRSQLQTQETCDLVEDFARTVTRVFWMREVGAPESMDQAFNEWSTAIIPMLAFECSQEQVAAANKAATEMWDFLLNLEQTVGDESLLTRIAQGIRNMPDDGPKHGADVISAITFDGIDSAASAIANVLYLVLRDDELQTLLRQHPEHTDDAVREGLRLETPLPMLQRATTAPITYAGVDIPEGINVYMAWGCGSRDPNAYEAPNEFKLERKNRTLLAFGGGKRFCKGRTLALIQCTVALKLLLENSAWIEIIKQPNWSPPGSIRTVESLDCKIQY